VQVDFDSLVFSLEDEDIDESVGGAAPWPEFWGTCADPHEAPDEASRLAAVGCILPPTALQPCPAPAPPAGPVQVSLAEVAASNLYSSMPPFGPADAGFMGLNGSRASTPLIASEAPAATGFQTVALTSSPSEVASLLEAVKDALLSSPEALELRLTESPLRMTTSIRVILKGGGGDSAGDTQAGTNDRVVFEALNRAKDALLTASAYAETAYVLGYASNPFQDSWDCGFWATIVCLPTAQQDMACWETYEKGFCPRRATCRWTHPKESEKFRLRVVASLHSPDEGGSTSHRPQSP
jgi:hypothetical protein